MGERQTGEESNQEGESILTQEFVDPILIVTKEFLKTHDHLGPALFIRLENDEQGIVPLIDLDGLKSTEERQEYFSSLGLSIRISGMRIREALFVSEVWYIEPEEEEDLDIPPSKHPKRKAEHFKHPSLTSARDWQMLRLKKETASAESCKWPGG